MKPHPMLLLIAPLLIAACATGSSSQPYVVALLQPTRGNTATGTIWLTQQGSEVAVRGKVSGLKPNQEHGFHVHEKGDCSSGDGMSTKGHFNPQGKPHAHPSTSERHAGDMPALKADAYGNARVDATLDIISVNAGPTSVIGRGLIVHAAPDDYKTQPTGNAGARLACAIINRKS